jgi:predicted nucleotidyltransferase
MRLTDDERQHIKQVFGQVFGQGSIYLFGSRVDDDKKGGDIDLWIETTQDADWFTKKIRFLAGLKRRIGDRKIDVVFSEDPSRLIEQEARKWAVPL